MNEHSQKNGTAEQIAEIERRFQAMHRATREEAPPGEAERKALLDALRGAIFEAGGEFVQTISQDYGSRSPDETLMAEIVPSLMTLRDASASVAVWMRPEPRGRSIPFWPGRNSVYWQPKGVVLIIAPWNYPLQLAVGPLAAALAAGNRAILKPSEFTPATSDLLKRCLEEALGTDRVTVATGGAEVAQALCQLPFDHILFTGSTEVGRKVMQAAAANLTPVTLELGGKSPAIVHEDFNLPLAAERIVRGKLLNAGQTCIAPDYVLAPRHRVEEFVGLVRSTVGRLYPRLLDNCDYTSIINARHYERLARLVADARVNGARVIPIDPAGELAAGEIGSPSSRKMLPVAITGVSGTMAVMREEIFGPLLPIGSYDTLEDAIAYVNNRPRPLALYYFDNDSARIEQVLKSTVSGGVTINDTIYHVAQEKLPFGGIGPSGMGSYHGREGFRAFSHAKGTFLQSRYTLTSILTPPYGKPLTRLLRLAVRRAAGRASTRKRSG